MNYNRTLFLAVVAAMSMSMSQALAQNCFHAPAPGIALGSGTDVVLPMQSIGFAFPLQGSTFTDLHISDHGIVFLSNGGVPSPPSSGDPLLFSPSGANLVSGSPMIAALWTDIVAAGATSQIWLDAGPSRCTVTWQDVQIFGMAEISFDLQLHLLPSGTIEFAFGPGATNASGVGGGSELGVCGVSLGGGAPLPGGMDLSAGGSVATATLFEQWTVPATFDLANRGLRLAPTSPGWLVTPLGAPVGCASTSNYGTGCGADLDSVYERFAAGAFDLTGLTVMFRRTQYGYAVTSSPGGSIVPPSTTAQPVAAGVQDGQEQFLLSVPMPMAGGSTDVVNVTTKGQVELGGVPGAIVTSPTVVGLLAWPNTCFHCWHDFDQSLPGSGAITFEEIGSVAYVTWNAVHSFQFGVPSTLQFQLDVLTGDVAIVFGATAGLADPANPNGCLVGYSVGGASADPGAADLSAAGAIAVADAGGFPLAIAAEGVPYLGNLGFGVRVSNVPAPGPIAFVYFGDQASNLSLTFAGLTNCTALSNFLFGSSTIGTTAGTGVAPVAIPNSVVFLGFTVNAQALALSSANPAGLITSNATWFTVGH
ncbi:MAG: hypothetical protein IPK26_20695 [Planctomycetes bacterium]|nr:hypothetical protein [Planctomycetota bacterium]